MERWRGGSISPLSKSLGGGPGRATAARRKAPGIAVFAPPLPCWGIEDPKTTIEGGRARRGAERHAGPSRLCLINTLMFVNPFMEPLMALQSVVAG